MTVIKIADLLVGIENRYDHIALQAKDYIADGEPVFTVSVSEEDIDAERLRSATERGRGYYESSFYYSGCKDPVHSSM